MWGWVRVRVKVRVRACRECGGGVRFAFESNETTPSDALMQVGLSTEMRPMGPPTVITMSNTRVAPSVIHGSYHQ